MEKKLHIFKVQVQVFMKQGISSIFKNMYVQHQFTEHTPTKYPPFAPTLGSDQTRIVHTIQYTNRMCIRTVQHIRHSHVWYDVMFLLRSMFVYKI